MIAVSKKCSMGEETKAIENNYIGLDKRAPWIRGKLATFLR